MGDLFTFLYWVIQALFYAVGVLCCVELLFKLLRK
jgi:hypothetical protein